MLAPVALDEVQKLVALEKGTRWSPVADSTAAENAARDHLACVEVVSTLAAPLAPEAVLANVERGVFQVPLRLDAAVGAIRALMRRYASVPMDLADACRDCGRTADVRIRTGNS
jgi:hypothetical protein